MKVYEKPKIYIGNVKPSKCIVLGNWDMQQVRKLEEYFVSGKELAGSDESIRLSYAK